MRLILCATGCLTIVYVSDYLYSEACEDHNANLGRSVRARSSPRCRGFLPSTLWHCRRLAWRRSGLLRGSYLWECFRRIAVRDEIEFRRLIAAHFDWGEGEFAIEAKVAEATP